MGNEDDSLNASLAHIVLCAVAGRGISRVTGASFTHPGMHANFFIHGIVGFFHFQSGLLSNDFKELYGISLLAARYLALPCLNADLRREDKIISSVHLLSGVIPFVVGIADKDNLPLGNIMIALNVISLCQYSHEHNREFGWYTAGAACVAYFVSTQASQKFLFPLALALMEYCAYRVWHVHYDPPPNPRGRRG